MSSAPVTAPSVVRVSTFARLHFGFLDLSHETTRHFGSVGLSIEAYRTTLTLSAGAPAALDDWSRKVFLQQLEVYPDIGPTRVVVEQAIPRHSGLGSGTQMALAMGTALQSYRQLQVDPVLIAQRAGRGRRSGIGIATFQSGGLVVDGGRGNQTTLPPLLARHAFPDAWAIVLIMDPHHQGLHGQQEKSAFRTLQPKSVAETHAVSHQLLMHGLPALIEKDFDAFAASIGVLQHYNATYFAPAQGGLYASQAVTTVIEHLQQQGHTGLGQTSWGPSGFVLMPSLVQAQQLQQTLTSNFAHLALTFMVTRAVNHGAHITQHQK